MTEGLEVEWVLNNDMGTAWTITYLIQVGY